LNGIADQQQFRGASAAKVGAASPIGRQQSIASLILIHPPGIKPNENGPKEFRDILDDRSNEVGSALRAYTLPSL
jgi:hypothetical protein